MANPQVISGQAIGGTVAVKNSTDLANLPTQGMSVGTTVYNLAVNSDFVLTVSSAALVTDQVVAVNGISGYRWVLGTGSSWQTLAQMYVTPNGDDGNNGKGWTSPKKTIYGAVQAIGLLGGGTVWVGEGSTVGGPVAGQGIWLRMDNMPDGSQAFRAATGFLPCNFPLRIIGQGAATSFAAPFSSEAATITGPSATRTGPALWVVGCVENEVLSIENLQLANAALFAEVCARVGVDYDRSLSGAPVNVNVASISRTGTTTTLTVTLPPGFTVRQGSRTSNVTTLHITNPGLPWPPWRVTGNDLTHSSTVHVVGDGVHFTTGDYTLTAMSNPQGNGNSDWTLSYTETAADQALINVSGMTVASHGLCAGEQYDLTSTDPHFQSTMYRVDSTTGSTGLSVTDIFNVSGNQSNTNIGFLNHQERTYGGTTNFRSKNLQWSLNGNDANAGPGIDVGSTQAIPPLFEDGQVAGNNYKVDGVGRRDERRMAAVNVYPGVGGGAGITMRDAWGIGTIYCEANLQNPATVDVRRTLFEQIDASLQLPTLKVVGNQFTTVIAQDVTSADGSQTAPTIVLQNVPVTAAQVTRTLGAVSGACVGQQNFNTANLWTSGAIGQPGYPNPWTFGQVTAWADGRITGKHPAGQRAMGVVTARFPNLIPDPATWTPNTGCVITATGSLAPDGSSTATNIASSINSGLTVLNAADTTNTWAAGGRFYMCGWVNAADSGSIVAAGLFNIVLSGAAFTGGSTVALPIGYVGAGWQFFSGFFDVASAGSSHPTVIIQSFTAGGSVFKLWGLTAGYIPDVSFGITENDVAEYVATVKHQPRYLKQGMSGTMEGQKLIAHGGIGTLTSNALVIGSSSGQVTLGGSAVNALPLYAADGTTIIGWIPLFTGTVH